MEKKSSQTAASKQKPKQERRWIRKEAKGSQCAGNRGGDRSSAIERDRTRLLDGHTDRHARRLLMGFRASR